ncbi:MAG: hypothetical protein GEU75_09745 [Dehalococcoidia bacterium]|nr:hypothetical protein [Dehalococcoidia bacterium]
MSTEIPGKVAADVKCYFCGHVTGQIIGPQGGPLRIGNFVPRPGYKGPEIKPGMSLRCERCHGPVFLEETTVIAPAVEAKLRARQAARQQKAA